MAPTESRPAHIETLISSVDRYNPGSSSPLPPPPPPLLEDHTHPSPTHSRDYAAPVHCTADCHLLEDYLQQQLSQGTYDLHANLALLKL